MMPDSNNRDLPFVRGYRLLGESEGLVNIGDIRAKVIDDPFWIRFADGWEPDTERIYRKYVHSGSTVLDIGAWIGSTILFALACGAEKIVALEPNPGSNAVIRQLLRSNPEIAAKITLSDRAIGSRNEILSMGLAKGETDTSTSGIGGNDFSVQAITLEQIIKEYDLDSIDLVKIDIEGAEVLLSEALTLLSGRQGQVVHLSIHVPFFPEGSDLIHFTEVLNGFDIEDDRGEPLGHGRFKERILSEESHPAWGTKHGNFFEVLLVGKG